MGFQDDEREGRRGGDHASGAPSAQTPGYGQSAPRFADNDLDPGAGAAAGERMNTGNSQLQPCPRHPQKRTALQCRRCGRHMCANCARSAPVGQQCVDCAIGDQGRMGVSPGAGRVRGLRRFGRATGRGRGETPVTRALIAVCVVVYLVQLIFPMVTAWGAMWPVGVVEGQWWRLVTSGFLHGSFLHLLMNMMVLHVAGRPVEVALGKVRFALFYLLSVLGGSAALMLWTMFDPQAWMSSAVGASGAGFGLFAAIYMLQRRTGASLVPITVLLGVNLIFGFVVPGIAWQAHVGGLLAGGLTVGGFVAATALAQKRGQQAFLSGGAAGAQQAVRRWSGLGTAASVIVTALVVAVAIYLPIAFVTG